MTARELGPVPRRQDPAGRVRKGAIVVVREERSYDVQGGPRRYYFSIYLDRVVQADRSGVVKVTQKAGNVGLSTTARQVFTLDRAVRARDLWSEHEADDWKLIGSAKAVVDGYVIEGGSDNGAQ